MISLLWLFSFPLNIFLFIVLSSVGVFFIVHLCACFCGSIEGSVARGHGLLSGWFKTASLFAYQIAYDGKTHLHGRKQINMDMHLAMQRVETEKCTYCVYVCLCETKANLQSLFRVGLVANSWVEVCVRVFMKTCVCTGAATCEAIAGIFM